MSPSQSCVAKPTHVNGLLTSQRRGKFYKTKMCKFYKTGACTRGSECVYAHSMCELEGPPDLHKTELCSQFTFAGFCDKGDACRFAHGAKELRQTSERKEHPNGAQRLPCGANPGSPNYCSGAVYQPVLSCLAVPIIVHPTLMMRTGCFGEQGSKAGQAAGESTSKIQWNSQVVSSNFRVEHVDAGSPHCVPLSKETCLDSDGAWDMQASDKGSCQVQYFSRQSAETLGKAYCEEALGEEEAAGLLQQVKGAFLSQALDSDTDLESCYGDDISDRCAQKDCKGSQGPWSRQTTAESSSSFVIDGFSRQTSACSEAEMEHQDVVLCIKNTFLEWRPESCTAALRSKSAEGRMEGLSI